MGIRRGFVDGAISHLFPECTANGVMILEAMYDRGVGCRRSDVAFFLATGRENKTSGG